MEDLDAVGANGATNTARGGTVDVTMAFEADNNPPLPAIRIADLGERDIVLA